MCDGDIVAALIDGETMKRYVVTNGQPPRSGKFRLPDLQPARELHPERNGFAGPKQPTSWQLIKIWLRSIASQFRSLRKMFIEHITPCAIFGYGPRAKVSSQISCAFSLTFPFQTAPALTADIPMS